MIDIIHRAFTGKTGDVSTMIEVPLIDVSTGAVEAAAGPGLVVCNAIGSCIAVIGYHQAGAIGGIAHAMLPGASPYPGDKQFRYIENSVDELVQRMLLLGARESAIEIALAGGGNVLKRPDDTVCYANVMCVIEYCVRRRLSVRAAALGGFLRRRIELDLGTGTVRYSEGDEQMTRLLWRPATGTMGAKG